MFLQLIGTLEVRQEELRGLVITRHLWLPLFDQRERIWARQSFEFEYKAGRESRMGLTVV